VGCCMVKDEQFSVTFTPKHANNQRDQKLNNSKMFTFKGGKVAEAITIPEHKDENGGKIDNLQISPINKIVTFRLKDKLNGAANLNSKPNEPNGNENNEANEVNNEPILEKKDKSSYNEKYSQMFTQALKDYNLNSIEFSRFQDFVMSSQNNNSLHFDINNINLIIENEENNGSMNNEELATYKKKIISSLNNHKLSNKKVQNHNMSPIKERGNENDITPAVRESSKLQNKYGHVFGDVEQNTSRSGRSYYGSHHNVSRRKVEDEGDFTNVKNNSVVSTERATNNIANEDDSKRTKIHSNFHKQSEGKDSKYNFNSNLFNEEQKLRTSKDISNIKTVKADN